jgi:hypothetical protein
MPKRKLVILSLLVVVFLICSQSALTLGAEKGPRTGNIVQDCIFLQEIKSTIKVIRDRNFCAEEVTYHKAQALCQGTGQPVPIVDKPSQVPAHGIGNPACSESIKVKKKDNPGYCYEYNSGGTTRYIPPGCNLW